MSELVSSAANPLVRRVRRLADRRTRRREAACFVEGIAPVWQAVDAGVEVEALLISPQLLAGSPAEELVARQEDAGVRVVRLTRELFTRLSDRDGPSGLAAIVRVPPARQLDDVEVQGSDFFVAAHELANPGNLGTIARTAEGLGAAGLILVGDGADPWAPQAVKASMGSLFHLLVAGADALDDVFAWAAARGVTTVTTSAHARLPLAEADLARPLVLLLGGERTGLPTEALVRGDIEVRVPMLGRATSFNVAVAAGMLMYEVCRQASARGGSA